MGTEDIYSDLWGMIVREHDSDGPLTVILYEGLGQGYTPRLILPNPLAVSNLVEFLSSAMVEMCKGGRGQPFHRATCSLGSENYIDRRIHLIRPVSSRTPTRKAFCERSGDLAMFATTQRVEVCTCLDCLAMWDEYQKRQPKRKKTKPEAK